VLLVEFAGERQVRSWLRPTAHDPRCLPKLKDERRGDREVQTMRSESPANFFKLLALMKSVGRSREEVAHCCAFINNVIVK